MTDTLAVQRQRQAKYLLRGQQGKYASKVRWSIQGPMLLCYTGEKCRFKRPLSEANSMSGISALLREYSDRKYSWLSKVAMADLIDVMREHTTS